MPRLRIAALTSLFGVAVTACIILVAAIGMAALSELKVRGPLYDRIVLGKDLVADILPPPEYIIESYLEATLALNAPATLAEHRDRLKALKADYDLRHDFWLNAEFQADIKSKLTQDSHVHAARFYAELENNFLPALGAEDMDKARQSYDTLSTAYAAHRAVIDVIVADTNAMNSAIEAEATASESRYMTIVWGAVATVLAVVVLGVLGILRGMISPVVAMTHVMKRLAEGHVDVTIPSAGRNDEIGEMAAAVQVFKDNALETEALRRRQEEERQSAELRKQEALLGMAETVERETRQAVEAVANRTERLAQNSAGMAQSADSVSDSSQNVAAAASQALSNAQTVAAASEQLSASIGEIAAQIETSRTATTEAVGASERAQTTILHLSQTVNRIGEVTQLISAIASQTNLLALNATIEAARAGEAGKGFAVVAGEVKNLANQTAKATEEITDQINQIQATTGQAVQAVQEITTAIQGVESVSAAVAAAIEQQGAATGEIARNVVQTSDAAREVSDRIAVVSSEAGNTGRQARDVSAISSEVADSISALSQVLIKAVRTATKDVDRRRTDRLTIDRHATVTVNGKAQQAIIRNIADGGAELAGKLADAVPGTVIELHIDGLDTSLTATICGMDDYRTHL
ncbi:MAG: HAMP domain-containing protein, partial [Magnetospirillum sp.]|nr:HAMP domain-containing protein [Magnetospirillum sp.]